MPKTYRPGTSPGATPSLFFASILPVSFHELMKACGIFFLKHHQRAVIGEPSENH